MLVGYMLYCRDEQCQAKVSMLNMYGQQGQWQPGEKGSPCQMIRNTNGQDRLGCYKGGRPGSISSPCGKRSQAVSLLDISKLAFPFQEVCGRHVGDLSMVQKVID